MKIVHIAPLAPYNEGWGYQENLLPKYQKKLGHDVTLVITNRENSSDGIKEIAPCDYVREDGVRVIRLKIKKYFSRFLTNFNSKLEVYELLKDLAPDFVFFHGLMSSSIYDVVKYKKLVNKNCVIVCDSHLDDNNYPYKSGYKRTILKILNRIRYKKVDKYVSKVYGVTPLRIDFVKEFFSVPKEKADLLIMGADDDRINFDSYETIRSKIREENGIFDEFLVVTGGKLDKAKNVLQLMKACIQIKGVKLLILGSVSEDIKDEFNTLISNNDNLIYVGWVQSDRVYDYYFAGDLIVFPGGHSVLWEQACASKTPCVFNAIKGVQHLNSGGNCAFVDGADVNALKGIIESLVFTENYFKMKGVAESSATDKYLYSNIAKKSLEI
jgi:hypothetical protein